MTSLCTTPPSDSAPPRFIFPARPINGGPLPKARPKRGTWLHEPKLNGWRAVIHAPSRTMWNRHGALLTIAAEFDEALTRLAQLSEASGLDLFDCEALERRHGIGRGSLFILDWIPTQHTCVPQIGADCAGQMPTAFSVHQPAATIQLLQRSAKLDHYLGRLPCHCRPHEGHLYRPDALPGTIETWAELQRLNREWGAEFYEGLVAKRTDSPYPLHTSAAQDFPQWMKHRWAF